MKLFTRIIFFGFSLIVSLTHAQTLDLDWAKNVGGTGIDFSNGIAVDFSGNVYTVGRFEGTADFDPGSGVSDITSTGSNDIFVLKQDALGNFIWAKTMGSTGDDSGNAITVDILGNVYLTGYFQGIADFDPNAGVTNLTSAGSFDIFVCKLKANGDLDWAKGMGGTGGDIGNSIALNGPDKVIFTGFFNGTADFDPGTGTTNLISAGGNNIFVSKLKANGDLDWAHSLSGTGASQSTSIAMGIFSGTEISQAVYVTGRYEGTVDFDPGAAVVDLTPVGGEDIFILAMNAAGNFDWAKSIGSSTDDKGQGITTDPTGNILLTGAYSGIADFDPNGGVSNLTPTTGTDRDIFVLKLDNTGTLIWAKSMGGSNSDESNDVTTDISGNVYTTGYFESTANFDPAGTFNLTANGRDIFISKLDNAGNYVWAGAAGGTGLDIGRGIAVDMTNNIFSSGSFVQVVDFDPGSGIFNVTYTGTAGNADGFIWKLKPTATTSCVSPLQRAALVKIYNDMGGASWTNNLGWLSANEDDWFGVTVTGCDVTGLVLENNNLINSLPTEIGDLSELIELNLSHNQLSGALPATLATCTALEIFDVEDNQLTGTIPTYFNTFNNLYSINLGFNQFSGSIPIELGGIPPLEFLSLANNQLTGSIPTELGSLINLTLLDLSRNQLSGSIPTSLGSLPLLTSLQVWQNQLTSSIPTELGSIGSLQYLNLYNNLLTGSIPNSLGSISGLLSLELNQNQLSGTIPNLGSTSLEVLKLSDNMITGDIPISLSSLSGLIQLDLDRNQLTGILPSELGLLTNLEDLNVYNNQLSGSLPIEYGNLTKLLRFRINDNTISGSVPIEYLAWNDIEILNLGNNLLDGIPTFTAPGITELNVDNNYLEFGDLEPNISVQGFTYSPQEDLPGGIASANAGSPLSIPFTTSGTANQYQWFKDGVLIPGATLPTFSIATTAISDAGNYTVAITSTIVTGITLNSPFVVTIDPLLTITLQPVDVTVCNGTAGVFSCNASGASNIAYQWQFSPTGPPAFSDIANGLNYSGATTATLSVNTSGNFGAGRYRCRINGDLTVEVITNDAGLFINPTLIAPTATGNSLCGTGVVTLNASGATNGEYRWYDVATGGTPIAGEVNSSYTTPSLTATTTYFVSINNGTCESTRTSVIAQIDIPPAAPATTGGSSCGTSAIIVNASGATNGEYRWYDVATGGTPIAGEVNSSYTTPSLTATTTYFVSINNGTCESTRTSVIAQINTPPAAPTTTGGSSCGTSAIIVNASGATNGEYRWYDVATGGTPIAGEVNSSYTTPSLTATTTYFVSINNGTCESTRTSVIAQIDTPPAAPTTTGGSSCGTSAVIVNASGATDGEYRWYDVATGGTAIAGEINSSYTTPSISTTATYFASINNGLCESSRSAAVATINSVPAKPLITTSGSTTLCTGQSVTLSAPVGFTYSWSTGATSQQIIVNASGNFTVQITNGGCTSVVSDPIVVSVDVCNQPPAIAPASIQAGAGESVTLPITNLLSDPDNNLDLSTLRIVLQPISGAPAFINSNNELIINYEGLSFAGIDELTIEVCDLDGECTQQKITIEVIGDIIVYNAISPNTDDKNPALILKYIEAIEETQKNKVSIFNRWGDLVWEGVNYDNTSIVFTGINKNGNELPTGTYFYKIEFVSGRKTDSGYLSLKR